ncbi:MAG: type II CRISPR-associated endonuclease Cas1 [Clostridia bacterium]|nr:type II CRISPR-associated endonuclease Cas1 [Clostridia bacterium]
MHIKKGQLEIAGEEATISIPLEDLATIICSGSGIRMSTMAQAQIAEAGISLMIIDEKYHPACMLIPTQANVRQTLVMREQVAMSREFKDKLWEEIIIRKIENQARALTILGREGSEKVLRYTEGITQHGDIDACEANAARDYFAFLHPGLNRQSNDSVNSCLNYGYAVIRNAIIRAVFLAGFQPAFGIHHDNYLNPFNLADDLIEPWRAMVDVAAVQDPGNTEVLSRKKRKELAFVLHHACLIDGMKVSILAGIESMVNSIRNRIVSGVLEPLALPIIVPIEIIEAIKE